MSIGLALLFNIRFPVNFDSPYQAVSVIDFWRKWHMTLSQFLRDYLYIRLGGNRFGILRKYSNIFLTMLIGGLWHGAGWTFILWGAYHGLLLIINHRLEDSGIKAPKLLGRVLTFLLVAYGWVCFRAPDTHAVFSMTQGLFGLRGLGIGETYYVAKREMIHLFIPLAIALLAPNAEYWAKKVKPNTLWGILFALMFAAGILCLNRESAFLYFQF